MDVKRKTAKGVSETTLGRTDFRILRIKEPKGQGQRKDQRSEA